MTRSTLVFLVSSMAALAYACDDDVETTPSPASTDGGGGDGSTTPGADGGGGAGDAQSDLDSATNTDANTGTDAAADSNVDANVTPAPCTDAELDAPGADHTAGGGVTINFPKGAAPSQYTPRCVKIKVGQTVSWDGKFENHPLTPFGGNTPNPIPATGVTPDGGVLTVTFSSAGTFGFRCDFHPQQMNGAVKVVP